VADRGVFVIVAAALLQSCPVRADHRTLVLSPVAVMLTSALGQKPSFWPVRQMSAHSLTAAKKQTSSNRCVPAKPTFLLPCSSVNDHSQWNGSF
jgi:hypothetical protein